MPLVHVMFDRQPEVICHVCQFHKAHADSLPCDDAKGTDGGCDHVQYAMCDCSYDHRSHCDICLNMGPPGSQRAQYLPALGRWLPGRKEVV